MSTPKRFNPHPILSPRWCPVHQTNEREECGLGRTEYGREIVEERERNRLVNPPVPLPFLPSPTFEEEYPDRETERQRRELAQAQAEIKRLKTPPALEPKTDLGL